MVTDIQHGNNANTIQRASNSIEKCMGLHVNRVEH